ncbi:MAG TPA: leucyl aminopeptidase [Microbacteriaceae bacterium]|nr:leucyl aminopeptidase [Microbacteriaceae bacterium]HQZ47295.1 leucyl aminopeptidase [Microbacteriaceae bacterium]HRA09270.1 leucyl aminopeptidase [Microbacteriaceae bacterium]
MANPTLSISRSSVISSDADAILLGIPTPGDAGWETALEGWAGLAEALRAIDFKGASGALVRVPNPNGQTPLYVAGLGKDEGAVALREAVGAAFRQLTDSPTVAIALPATMLTDAQAIGVLEGSGLGAYSYGEYRTDGGKQRASAITLHTELTLAPASIRDAQAVVDAVALVKTLVTTPANDLGPADLAERAVEAVAGLPVEVEILDEVALAEGGYGGILGVGIGSERPPRMIKLSYSPAGATQHVALVGKGITFDTGGLSLKPAGSMVGMKYDMCGSATVLAVLRAAAVAELPVRVTAWMCVAENMPSGRATRPGDVLRMLNGTTVEVLNTDAEGRLVLADGLVAASRERPDLIVDVATLTGAITVALGTRHAGVMGDDAAVASYLDAAAQAGEAAWQLPLPPHMKEDLQSSVADLQNAKIGDAAGGSLFAGLFLQEFVGRTSDDADAPLIPWVHLDIAGVGMNKGAGFGYTDKGVSGATVRSLITLLANHA